MIGWVWGLRKLVMEWNRLTGRRFVCCQDLHIVHSLGVANYESSHCSSSDVVHLLESGFVKDRGPLFTSFYLETRKHDCAILTGGFEDFLVVLEEILLQLHEVSPFVDGREHQRERLALLDALGGIFADLYEWSNQLLCDIDFNH